jgi:hypothetical protein
MAVEGGAADTTAVAGTGMPLLSLERRLESMVGTSGAFSLISTTEGTTVQAMGTGMARATGTDTDMFDPDSIQITITKEQSLFLFKMIEPAAVLRPTWVALLNQNVVNRVVLGNARNDVPLDTPVLGCFEPRGGLYRNR